jgi:hypothetical protein
MRDLLAQDLAKVPPLNATQIENKTVGFDPSRLPDHYQTAQGIIYTPDQILGGQRKALLDVKGLMPRQISLAPGVVAERTADLPGPARAYDQPANIVLSTALANEPYQTGTNFFFWPSYNAPREQALER